MKVISVSLPNLVQSGEQKTDGAGATNTDPALTIDLKQPGATADE